MHLILGQCFQWCKTNMDIVFFIYGLAFVIVGVAILVQPKKDSNFKLADILWLLAAFGITHGANELLDMWAIIKGRNPLFDIIRSTVLVTSYLFLFEFGRRFFRICKQKYLERFTKWFGWWVTLIIGLSVLAADFMFADFWKSGTIWARYLLGFPGRIFNQRQFCFIL